MSSKKEFFKLRLKEVGDKVMKEVKYLNIGYDDIISVYDELGVDCPIRLIMNRMDGFLQRGWGNGYVMIPEGHQYYGKSYDDIDVSVHGGLTYGSFEDDGKYWVGFDTSHYGDDLKRWPKSAVFEETMMLFNQI